MTLPPAVVVAAASAMKHCVLRSDGVNALYSFTEDPPANAGRPAFEAGGVKVYAASADLNVQYETPVSPAIVEQEVVPAPAPAPAPEPARDPPAASAIVSSPGPGVGGESCGKSGAAVFERGVGIAAWQGLEIGYEMDVVIEVPTVAGVESAVAGAEMAAETAPDECGWQSRSFRNLSREEGRCEAAQRFSATGWASRASRRRPRTSHPMPRPSRRRKWCL